MMKFMETLDLTKQLKMLYWFVVALSSFSLFLLSESSSIIHSIKYIVFGFLINYLFIYRYVFKLDIYLISSHSLKAGESKILRLMCFSFGLYINAEVFIALFN